MKGSTAKKSSAGATRAAGQRGSLDRVLIDAAMDLFAAYGYRGTSLARIARAAGVTKGALYWHFSDKEEFFLAVTNKVLGEWAEVLVNPHTAETSEDYRREFLRMFEQIAELNESNPWVSRLLLIITLESHKLGKKVLSMMRAGNLNGLQHFRTLVERGKSLGALDPKLDASWAAMQIFSSYIGLAMFWYLHGDSFRLTTSLMRQAEDFLERWSNQQ
jgi:AcrR family transcriptional regulator